ncbi:MAG: GNAT family N-acetyltransferase, partial [Treponema sp.]|nr:GNAT family N-acetyltransferase [Treponema sp.]
GTATMEFAKSYYKDWKKFTLVTPADKNQNVKFYTEKCGFRIDGFEMDSGVKVARFVLKRD